MGVDSPYYVVTTVNKKGIAKFSSTESKAVAARKARAARAKGWKVISIERREPPGQKEITMPRKKAHKPTKMKTVYDYQGKYHVEAETKEAAQRTVNKANNASPKNIAIHAPSRKVGSRKVPAITPRFKKLR